ncbi:cryptochrome/photolyase family protein [soil metagenome]
MKSEAVLIFPNQLFENHPQLNKDRSIFIVEHPRFFTDFHFHKQKLILHRASMQAYYDQLREKKYKATYVNLEDVRKLPAQLKALGMSKIYCIDVVDHALEKELKKQYGSNLEITESPAFLSTRAWLNEALGDKDHYLMNSFYIAQRKHLNILVANGKPTGGKWSYDAENRLKMPKDIVVPPPWKARAGKYLKEAQSYVEKHFANNPGETKEFLWPITHDQAKRSLYDFLENRLTQFGPYQDAIDTQHNTLFHSLLSSSINNGLLAPDYVIAQTIAHAKKHKTPLNSLEGFIRQIIGWREFVRGIYLIKGEYQRKQNFFNHKNKLPKSFWTATTGIEPIDLSIQKVLELAYAHHIERLMILGNFMLLARIDPDQVYNWFMELFIDAYDWVMVPNVYGMSQYADGGLMTTKPYFSGSNYIKKMSNFKKGNWCELWDALYWAFIYENRLLIKNNARMASTGMYLRKMKPEQLQRHLQASRQFFSEKP